MAEPTLRRGSEGKSVKELQTALRDLGFDVGAVDGVFGAQTEKAVKSFQAANEFGLEVDGIVGRATWKAIDEADQSEPILKRGSRGNPVRRLQSRMEPEGFFTAGVNGIFGPKTETAVKDLQRLNELTVDGIVGPRTWAVVNTLAEGGA